MMIEAGREREVQRGVSSRSMSSRVGSISFSNSNSNTDPNRKRGMILPFQPLSITFDDIHYAVDMPQVVFSSLSQLILVRLQADARVVVAAGNEGARH